MTPFVLNRFDADQGTFRLSGRWSATKLEVVRLAWLGTDGWVELDLQHPNTRALVDAIEANVLTALSAGGGSFNSPEL